MAPRHHLLMCPPDHFTVNYSINPWMEGEEGEVSLARAKEQWAALRGVLADIAEVELIAPVPKLPDMVFTANAGAVYQQCAIISRFKPPQRRGEEPHFRNWFEARGFRVLPWPEELVFEGAGDALCDRAERWVWAGYGQRTDRAAHELLKSLYSDREIISLHLVDPFYYHIDTCMAPLEDGYLMYYPGAFDKDGRAEIERRVPAARRIAVTSEEAEQFACNAVSLGGHVVMNRPSARLRGVLTDAGFEVVPVDLAEFIKSGGSAKCLVLRLDEP